MYHSFTIPKKSGGVRKILAPVPELKEKQREILQKLYKSGARFPFSYGFIPGRSIVDNAMVHVGKRFVLNIDIKDFFPSCRADNRQNEAQKKISRYLTEQEIKILFYRDMLPQGAPTSPYVSNFFMEKADVTIFWLFRVHISDDIMYSRYADDITISSNSRAIFSRPAINIIRSVLQKYGFSINKNKIRKLSTATRQEITGIVINSGKPTISRQFRRKIRAAVHNAVREGISKKQYNKIKGYLAFIMQCPSHRIWAKQKMADLEVAYERIRERP